MENVTSWDVIYEKYRKYVTSGKSVVVFCDIVIGATIVFGLLGNIMICFCVLKCKHLRTHLNVNLVSSCVANIIGCCFLLPVRIILHTGYPPMEYIDALCKIGTFFRTLCDTLQFFMLTVASIERYQAIMNPFKKDGRWSRALLLVIGSWSLALTLSALSTILFVDSTLFVPCFMLNDAPQWGHHDSYLILPLGLSLISLIIVAYLLIIKTLVKHSDTMKNYAKRNKPKVAPTNVISDSVSEVVAGGGKLSFISTNRQNVGILDMNLGSNMDIRNKPTDERSRMDSKIYANSNTLNVPNVLNGKNTTNTNENVKLTTPTSSAAKQLNVPETTAVQSIPNLDASTSGAVPAPSTINVVSMDGTVRVAKSKDRQITGDICVMNKRNKEQGKRRVEMRASRKIAALIGSFACCWFPLPLYVISLLPRTELTYGQFQTLLLLGTLGSTLIAVNPIMYGVVNRSLNSALKHKLDFRQWTIFKKK